MEIQMGVDHEEKQGQQKRRRRGKRRGSKDWTAVFDNKFGPFIYEFEPRRNRMLHVLKDLEETTDQLNFMKKGVEKSTAVGYSLGAVGGVLTIFGLVLIEFAFVASLSLLIIGIGLGLTSGLGNVVTKATEIKVNTTQQNRSEENLKKFSENLQTLQRSLKEMEKDKKSDLSTDLGESSLSKCIEDISAKVASELKAVTDMLNMFETIGKVAARGYGHLTKKTKSNPMGYNTLCGSIDLFCSNNDNIQLVEGYESHIPQLIRDRVKGCYSMMDSLNEFYNLIKNSKASQEKDPQEIRWEKLQ